MYVKKKTLKAPPVKKPPPSMFPLQGLYGERRSVSRASGLFISVGVPQKRSPPTKCGENIHHPGSPTETEGLTYSGVRPGSPRVSLTALLSLTQCHSVFSTIPSALAWVDQSRKPACVVVTLYRVYPPYLLPPPT